MNAGSILNAAHKADRQGDKEKAAELYHQLLSEYPGTKEASSARLDLAEIDPTALSQSLSGSKDISEDSPVNRGSHSTSQTRPAQQGRLVINSKYKTTRVVLSLASVAGWLTLVVGVSLLIAAGVILLNSGDNVMARVAAGPTAGGGVGLIVSGLMLVMFSQLTRAAVDSADYAREALVLARQRAT